MVYDLGAHEDSIDKDDLPEVLNIIETMKIQRLLIWLKSQRLKKVVIGIYLEKDIK